MWCAVVDSDHYGSEIAPDFLVDLTKRVRMSTLQFRATIGCIHAREL
jgi:hypothetical protein